MELPWKKYNDTVQMDVDEAQMMRNYGQYIYRKYIFIVVCISRKPGLRPTAREPRLPPVWDTVAIPVVVESTCVADESV